MASQATPIQRRARAQLSCTLCRSSKLKCDRQQPCDQCVRRSKDSQCHYPPAPKKKPRKPSSTTDRIAQLESLVVTLMKQDPNAGAAALAAADNMGNGAAKADEPVQELTPESRGALSSPETQLDGSEEESSDEGSDLGQISMSNGGANYVGGAHWESILSRIKQLKTSMGSEADEGSHQKQNEQDSAARAKSRLLQLGPSTITKEYLLQACPPREVADRLLYMWFNSHNALLPLTHRPTFLNEYEKFLQNPTKTSLAWLGMFFGMLSLGSQVSSLTKAAHEAPTGQEQDFKRYEMLCSEALCLADITKPQKYIVEALMTSAACEHLRGDAANGLGLWLKLSLVMRLCLRMGYHRDPSLLKTLTPYECEIRRRVWYTIYIVDVLVSFSLGLPDMIRHIQSDTKAPRNLNDSDFGTDTVEMPPSRPLTELTPVAYGIVKSDIAKQFARAADISHSLAAPAIKEVISIDEDLEEAYGKIPDALKFISMRQCMFDPPPVIYNRFKLQLLYQKTKCVLYRRYLSSKHLSPEEEPFRDKCSEAAINLLKHWETLHDASRQGGQLASMPFFFNSLSVADFLLAVMIACLEYDRLRKSPGNLDSRSEAKLAAIREVLESTYRVYAKSLNQTPARMSEKALQALSAILTRAQIIPPASQKTESPSFALEQTSSYSPAVDMPSDGAYNAQAFPTPSDSLTPSWSEPLSASSTSTAAFNWQFWDASLRNSMMMEQQPAQVPNPYMGIDMNLDMVGGLGGFNTFDGPMNMDFTATVPWQQ